MSVQKRLKGVLIFKLDSCMKSSPLIFIFFSKLSFLCKIRGKTGNGDDSSGGKWRFAHAGTRPAAEGLEVSTGHLPNRRGKVSTLACVFINTNCCKTYCFLKVRQAELFGFGEKFALMHEAGVENDVGLALLSSTVFGKTVVVCPSISYATHTGILSR